MAIKLLLLGSFRILSADNTPPPSLDRKTRAILAYLAATGRRHSRQSVADLFCHTAKDPAGSLRWHISRIRRGLSDDVLDVSPGEIGINTAVVRTDLASFQETAAATESQSVSQLTQAVDLVRGPFLSDLTLRNAAEFEMWLLGERTILQQQYEKISAALIDRLISQEAFQMAIERAQTLLQSNPLLEPHHRQLIWLYARTGQRPSALAQYAQCQKLLRQELAVAPSAEVQELFNKVQANQPLPPLVPASTSYQMPAPLPQDETFIGRQTELGQLQRVWGSVLNKGSGILLVCGEAGVGKTHLLNVFQQALPATCQRLIGHCYESTRNLPYQPWLSVLDSFLAQFPARVSQIAPQWQSQLAHLLPNHFPASGRIPEQQSHLFRAVVQLLFDSPKDHPRFVLIEDLQWADEASQQLFLYVAQHLQTAAAPVLLIGSYRSEELAGQSGLRTMLDDCFRLPAAESLVVRLLDDRELMALIEQMWPDLVDKEARITLRDGLRRETGGSPLFATEILRELRQTDVWPTPLPIPESLKSLIDRRLRQLPVSSRQVLETLAILDRPSHFELAQQISGRSEAETLMAIEQGLNWHILQPGDDAQYDFSHDLVRQAVQQQLSDIRYRRLHHRAAVTLTHHHASAATLAYHWRMAGDKSQEAEAALRAGQEALATAAFRSAEAHFDRLLIILPAESVEQRFQALLGLVRSVEVTTDVQTLQSYLNRLDALAIETAVPQHRAQVAYFKARAFRMAGKLELASQEAANAEEWAVEAGDLELQADSLHIHGHVLQSQGKYENSLEKGNAALRLYVQLQNVTGEGRTLVLLGNTTRFQGNHRQAADFLRQALGLFRRSGDLFRENRALDNLSNVLWNLGENEEALHFLHEGIVVSRKIGDKMSEASKLNSLGGIATVQGDTTRALSYYQDALSIVTEFNHREAMAVCFNNVASAYTRLDESEQAVSFVNQALALAQEDGIPRLQAQALYTRAVAYSTLERYEKAHQDYLQSLAIRQELGARFELFNTYMGLVFTAVHLEDLTEAAAHFAAAESHYANLANEIPIFTHQQYHFAAFTLYAAQNKMTKARNHLRRANRFLQDRLEAMPSDALRQLVLQKREIQELLSAVSHHLEK